MNKNVPPLAAIGERFSNINPDCADTRGVEIRINEKDLNRYRVIARRQPGSSAGGFIVNVTVEGGQFSKHGPDRVEIGRAPDGMIRHEIDDTPADFAGGFVNARIGSTPPAQETLLLPGDDSFNLFEQLHAQVSDLREPMEQALGTISDQVPTTTAFEYREGGGTGISYDYDKEECRLDRQGRWTILGTNRELVSVELDGTLTIPFSDQNTSFDDLRDPMTYRSGVVATSWEQRLIIPGDETLMAFAALHAQVARLYK